MRVLAPAKINLFLRVGGVRADGFHPLWSWMVTVGLFDTLTLDRSQSTPVELTCDDPSIPTDDRNLVVQAARALHAFREDLGCAIHLSKSIPHGAGLGGGSSDAARALLALNRLWKLDRSVDDLQKVGATLGSDVPFFFHAPSAICTGRGEMVRPTVAPPARWALLLLPDIRLPTAQVYREFDARRPGKAGAREPRLDSCIDPAACSGLDAMSLLERLENDLEAPAFAISPGLGALRERMEKQLDRVVRMSGSGSTLYTLFDERQEAEAAQQTAVAEVQRSVVVEVCPAIADDLSGGR